VRPVLFLLPVVHVEKSTLMMRGTTSKCEKEGQLMPEQTTTVNEDGSITIIATMVPSDAPLGDALLGLQLMEEGVKQRLGEVEPII
jgi:hypothetical protein